MSRTASNRMMPPSIDELMVGFLNRAEENESLAAVLSEMGEVEPHEVAVGYRTEPRSAWLESLAVLKHFGTASTQPYAPAEWASLVARTESVAGLPMAVGNYPQRVRDLTKLLAKTNLLSLICPVESRPVPQSLRKWAESMEAQGNLNGIVAVGVLRFAGDLNAAEEMLVRLKAKARIEQLDLIENEQAAIFWQQGKTEAAISIWRELSDSIPVLFNRGMAALFLNQKQEARECLKKVLAQLPNSNSWHHLAGLYLALAEM
jgi:tetratricopeptide (TPR) repeat protein